MSRGPGVHQRAILAALMSQPTTMVPLICIVPSQATQSQYQAWHRAAVTLKRRGLVEACRVPGRKLIALRLAGSDARDFLSVDLPQRERRNNSEHHSIIATIRKQIRATPMNVPELMTPADMAAFLQLQQCTVRELASKGVLPPPIKLTSKTLRWRRSDVFTAFGLSPVHSVPQVNQELQQ